MKDIYISRHCSLMCVR